MVKDDTQREDTDDPCKLVLRLLEDGHPQTAIAMLRTVTSAPKCHLHPLSRVGVALASTSEGIQDGRLFVFCCACNAKRYE